MAKYFSSLTFLWLTKVASSSFGLCCRKQNTRLDYNIFAALSPRGNFNYLSRSVSAKTDILQSAGDRQDRLIHNLHVWFKTHSLLRFPVIFFFLVWNPWQGHGGWRSKARQVWWRHMHRRKPWKPNSRPHMESKRGYTRTESSCRGDKWKPTACVSVILCLMASLSVDIARLFIRIMFHTHYKVLFILRWRRKRWGTHIWDLFQTI